MYINKKRIESLSLCLLISLVSVIAFKFSVSDQLAGFSDDSGTYLLMAKVFSLFSDAPQNIFDSYQHYHLPPGFPFILSLINSSNTILAAHYLVFFQAILSLILFYYLCKVNLGVINAFAGIIIFICIPGFWLHMLKIGSDYQYVVLSLGFLVIYYKNNGKLFENMNIAIFSGVLLSFCILTRTIGFSLFIAYMIIIISNKHFKNKTKELGCFIISFSLPLLFWNIIQPDKSHSYYDDLFYFLHHDDPAKYLFNLINDNILAIYNSIAFNFSLTLFLESHFLKILFGIIFGCSIIGWIKCIKRIDGLYILFYILVLLVWPYPLEMERFVLPLIPLLIFYFLVTLNILSHKLKYSSNVLLVTFVLMVFLLTASALKLIFNRYNMGTDQYGENISHITELYEIKNTAQAIAAALIMNRNLENIKSSNIFFKKEDKVLTVKPQLFTYLTGIYAEELPRINAQLPGDTILDLWFAHIRESHATHLVLLPIQLSPGYNEVDVIPLISEETEKIISYGYMSNGQEKIIFSILRVL